MSERGLGQALSARLGRLVWGSLGGYAVLVVAVFAIWSEIALRRSLERSADVLQALIGLYGDPQGERTTVAPQMLADQLVSTGAPFLITRTAPADDGERVLYFLSPSMPAKVVRTPEPGAPPAEVRAQLARAVTAQGGWRYRMLHRQVGEFDILLVGSRVPGALALAWLSACSLLLLPAAALLSRRVARRQVAAAIAPLTRVAAETQSLEPEALHRRVTSPTGVGEVTAVAAALNRLLARVERAHRSLQAFTGDASHELRTPLTHLRAQAQWALDERRDPEAMREAVAGMLRETERMGRLVDDLLLLARGDNRQLPVERRPFDLLTVVREVEEITAAMASERGLVVQAALNGPMPALGDPGRTRQVLLNLASNAVRYTTTGRVDLTCLRHGTMVGVAVRDTGCGIAPPDIERIFDRFYRVDRSRARDHGGTGLGLAIARLLAELQGGHIAVDSEPGRGSVLTLWLPSSTATPG